MASAGVKEEPTATYPGALQPPRRCAPMPAPPNGILAPSHEGGPPPQLGQGQPNGPALQALKPQHNPLIIAKGPMLKVGMHKPPQGSPSQHNLAGPLRSPRETGPFDRAPAHSPLGMQGPPDQKHNASPNKTPANDPLSHRIIEKRRRDRMNNCLADLSRLIPTYYLKKGRGRIEKTEIIEMAIKYMKHLQANSQGEGCDVATKQEWPSGPPLEQFHHGYQECMSETMNFLVESEGLYSGDSLCVRLMNHLTKHCEKVLSNEGYVVRQSGASSSSSSGYHASNSTGSSSDNNNEDLTFRPEDRSPEDLDDKGAGSFDGHGASSMGSQLREILQHSQAAQDRRSNAGYNSGLSSNNSSSGDDSSRLYKFKSNMKHRFSADLEQVQVRKKRRDSESSCGNYTDCEKPLDDGGKDSPALTEKGSAAFSSQEPKAEPDHRAPEGPPVPIFALSPNGSFYVPLTLPPSALAAEMESLPDSQPLLHPVSIYVNFCAPRAAPRAPPPLPASPSPPPTQRSAPPGPPNGAFNGHRISSTLKERKRRNSRPLYEAEDSPEVLPHPMEPLPHHPLPMEAAEMMRPMHDKPFLDGPPSPYPSLPSFPPTHPLRQSHHWSPSGYPHKGQ